MIMKTMRSRKKRTRRLPPTVQCPYPSTSREICSRLLTRHLLADKAPPAKKAKTAPAEEQEEPEEEAEGEEDQEEPEEEFDEEAGGAEDEDDAEVVGNGTDKTKADVADAPEAAGEKEKEAVADEGDEE